jgi:hypothetical protein
MDDQTTDRPVQGEPPETMSGPGHHNPDHSPHHTLRRQRAKPRHSIELDPTATPEDRERAIRALQRDARRWRRARRAALDKRDDLHDLIRYATSVGVGKRAISQATGLGPSHVTRIRRGLVNRRTHDAELEVDRSRTP